MPKGNEPTRPIPTRIAAGMKARIVAVTALTSAATFATLELLHQLFFTQTVFA